MILFSREIFTRLNKALGSSSNGNPGGGGGVTHGGGGRVTSKTAPARLEGVEEDEIEDNVLLKVHTTYIPLPCPVSFCILVFILPLHF